MGQVGSTKIGDAFQLATSHLSEVQLAEIGGRFNEIYSRGGNRGGHLLNREEFARHFDLPVVLGDRLFTAFDIDKSGSISFEEFVCGLTICLHGTVIDKAALLFKAFNLDEDEGVSRQELATMLNGSLKSAKTIVQCTTEHHSSVLDGGNEEEIVQKVVEEAFQNCDITKTGKLLPIEFEYWLKRHPQFMDSIFSAICPETKTLVHQSSLLVPDNVTESVPIESDEQLMENPCDIVTTSVLRSEPSLENIMDEVPSDDVITEEDSIQTNQQPPPVTEAAPIVVTEAAPVVVTEAAPVVVTTSLKSPLEMVEDYYTRPPHSESQQSMLSTSEEEAEETELVVEDDGEESMINVFPDEDPDTDSPLSSLARKVHSLKTKLTENETSDTRTIPSVASLSSPTLSITSLPPTPDLEPERMHVAWLPSEHTRQLLNARKSGVSLDYQFLTSPGLNIEGPFVDPVSELLNRYDISQDVRRPMMTADSVVPDPRGFRTLVANGCYRAALDLAGKFLSANGQGLDRRGLAGALHTHKTLQVWMCRVALLVKLHLHGTAQAELEAFGDFDRPDLYFEFHADIYPEHTGSLVPFSLRLLHAELPQHSGGHHESLDRLYNLLHACRKIESSLDMSLSEDSSNIQLSATEPSAAQTLWRSRSVQVTYAIANCLVGLKDFCLAVSVFESLLDLDPDRKVHLLCGIGRIYLQLGNITAAITTFSEVDAITGPEQKAIVNLHLGLVQVALANYREGQKLFQEVLQLQPDNAVAVNNLSACLVYQGKLKEAVTVLEELVWRNPAENLQESVLLNLCTAYELESSQAFNKKKNMLSLVASHRGDSLNVDCLKIGS